MRTLFHVPIKSALFQSILICLKLQRNCGTATLIVLYCRKRFNPSSDYYHFPGRPLLCEMLVWSIGNSSTRTVCVCPVTRIARACFSLITKSRTAHNFQPGQALNMMSNGCVVIFKYKSFIVFSLLFYFFLFQYSSSLSHISVLNKRYLFCILPSSF